jgi:PAS domain-containing protein
MASSPDDSGSTAATRHDSTTDSDHVLYPSAGVIVWSRDITDRKHTEQRLAHQAQVLDNAPEAIVAAC